MKIKFEIELEYGEDEEKEFEDIDYLQDYIEKSNNPYLKELFINDVSFNVPDYIEPSKLRISTMK